MNLVPEALRPVYGRGAVFGGMIFARLTVAPMRHAAH